MKWTIPAKTFLLGEYAALQGEGAIILTTSPVFELSLVPDNEEITGIHPQSPAGLWWAHHRNLNQGLVWQDPYHDIGGVGASSAQFLGTYLASCHVLNMTPNLHSLMDAYYQSAWQGVGLRPSGYDVLAQTQKGCVYINRQKNEIKNYNWPFKDISFILLHSGQKLATHYHLQKTSLPTSIEHLAKTVELAKKAFDKKNSIGLIDAINQYQHQLTEMNLMAKHSLSYIKDFKNDTDILAIKGCGALGADVLLLIVPSVFLDTKLNYLSGLGWTILATNRDLYADKTLMKNNQHKRLEILP